MKKSLSLITSDAADEEDSVDLGGRRIIKKKKRKKRKKRKILHQAIRIDTQKITSGAKANTNVRK